jgi:ribosomal peptide maturation radical SAM protein 1
MAKLIKDLYPDVTIVFGGANFDGEMGLEYFRAFPFIDHVVVGEGEEVFPELVRYLLAGKIGTIPSGVAYRKGAAIEFTPNSSLFSGFANTGPPDYDDYYHLLAEMGEAAQGLDRILLYEGSRGCWWGEKHHCTFCGLNAQSMKFRAKSPEQVALEMAYLSNRYDTVRFRLVDNIIDMKYVESLFGRFAADHYDFDVFIETKSNLQKSQIRTLAAGGVKCMQPGLESLSLNQLRAMDKGVTPMQNIICLKWSSYYRVAISWNLLLGFPGETNEDYRHQIDLIPWLFHLHPPEGAGKFWLERFSPYYTKPHEYGVRLRRATGGLEKDRLRLRIRTGLLECRPAALSRIGRPGAGVATTDQFKRSTISVLLESGGLCHRLRWQESENTGTASLQLACG